MPLSTPIVQLIDRDTVTIDADSPLGEAVRALAGERFHHLPVVEDGRLVGIVSSTDLLELGVMPAAGSDTTVVEILDRAYRLRDVMQPDPITVSHRATVADAARLLSAGGFHALPVIDEHRRLLGIVTTTDLIGHMLDAVPDGEIPAALRLRVRLLEAVLSAATLYLRSGMAVSEHEALERAVEAARRSD